MKHTKLLLIVAMVISSTILHAQNIKNVSISPDTAFTEQLSLKADDKDMDITLKIAFDELKNQLVVSINAAKMLFVFWDDTRYKKTVTHRWLRPSKLPYVVSCHPQDRFRFTKESRHRMHHPYRQYVFRKWIDTDEDLQAVESDHQMLNERLEQLFKIQGMLSNVTIRLRDILLMEQGRQRGMGYDYDLIYGKDLNTEYQISLRRNPCLGLDNEIQLAKNNLSNIRQSYAIFRKKYGRGVVTSQEEMNAFHDLQETLVAKYPKDNTPSPCSDIQGARTQYNALVDSILSVSVTMEITPADALAAIGGDEGHALNAKSILSNARLLDNTISRWLISRDQAERSDLDEQCRNIIHETSAMIGNRLGQTSEERNAIALFRKAVHYYKRTCK